MNDRNRISVVIPVYNVENYISECIDSVLNQLEIPYEIILIDDGSTDRSYEICKLYAEKYSGIKLISQKNQGVAAARNRGIDEAKGDWILFIDSDDIINENLLKDFSPFLKNNCDIGFFGFKYFKNQLPKDMVSSDDFHLLRKNDLDALIPALFNRDLKQVFNREKIKIASPCRFYKRTLLIDKNIRFPLEIKTGEDAVFNLYVLKNATNAIYNESPYYLYRKRDESVTNRYFPQILKEYEKVDECYKLFLNKYSLADKYDKYMQERIVWSFSFACLMDYCHKDNKKSYNARKAEFEKERTRILKSLNSIEFKDFKMNKKVFFLCIKMNWFKILDIICKMN